MSGGRAVLLCDAEEAEWPDLGPWPVAVTACLPGGPMLDAPQNAVAWPQLFDRMLAASVAAGPTP